MTRDPDSPTGRPRTVRAKPLAEVVAHLGMLAGAGVEGRGLPGGPGGPAGPQVTGTTLSSRQVRAGDLYAALPGSRAHGADYAPQAVAAGAVAILTDPDGAQRIAAGSTAGVVDVPVLVVPRPRELLGRLAAWVLDDPARTMRVVGVTGTQGKTTTTRLLEAGLQGSGAHAAVVGTLGTRVDGVEVKSSLTTPEAPELHALFALMLEHGVTDCAMEVSSHALVQGRVDGVVVDVAVFLNLGRDHLDFHADLEDYFVAKASLFTPERARRALVNVDDEHGRRLAELAAGRGLPVATFSPGARPGADWYVEEVRPGPEGSDFTLVGPSGLRLDARVPLPGDVNVANALAALAAAAESGVDPAPVAAALAVSGGVPGRFERVVAPDPGGRTVLVDYAHKPDAVAAALRTLRPLTNGRLVVVLGAGGDRDTGKRPLMGQVAADLADLLVVTDDNPRSEDPGDIRAAVIAGTRQGTAEVLEVAGRREAIAEALRRTGAGDVVVLAGKGHETGQDVAGVVHPFDDRLVAAELLAELAADAGGPG